MGKCLECGSDFVGDGVLCDEHGLRTSSGERSVPELDRNTVGNIRDHDLGVGADADDGPVASRESLDGGAAGRGGGATMGGAGGPTAGPGPER